MKVIIFLFLIGAVVLGVLVFLGARYGYFGSDRYGGERIIEDDGAVVSFDTDILSWKSIASPSDGSSEERQRVCLEAQGGWLNTDRTECVLYGSAVDNPEQLCIQTLGGTFDACVSPCRYYTGPGECAIDYCVPVCSLE